MLMEKRVFSGIQPSGNLHIGNYIGAVRQWVKGQNDGLNIFCIVDMHAITVDQDPSVLREKTLELASLLIACGIDPEKSLLFVQSHNPDHANLAWILNCNTSMGELSRMTQYKDKSLKNEFVSAGLFDYPVLMAADILLYDTTQVPVGDDQKQHVELTRDIATRFNNRYDNTFELPEAAIPQVGARIMSLTDPEHKMSKSDDNAKSRIELLDSHDEIISKFKSSVTDSGSEIKYDVQNKAGISNLIEIYSEFSDMDIKEVEEKFKDSNYGDFKVAVGESVTSVLEPIQKKYNELRSSDEIKTILENGAQKAREISSKKLNEVYKKVGFVI